MNKKGVENFLTIADGTISMLRVNELFGKTTCFHDASLHSKVVPFEIYLPEDINSLYLFTVSQSIGCKIFFFCAS